MRVVMGDDIASVFATNLPRVLPTHIIVITPTILTLLLAYRTPVSWWSVQWLCSEGGGWHAVEVHQLL